MKYSEVIQTTSDNAIAFSVLCKSESEASNLQEEASNKFDVACAEVHTSANGHLGEHSAVTITLK